MYRKNYLCSEKAWLKGSIYKKNKINTCQKAFSRSTMPELHPPGAWLILRRRLSSDLSHPLRPQRFLNALFKPKSCSMSICSMYIHTYTITADRQKTIPGNPIGLAHKSSFRCARCQVRGMEERGGIKGFNSFGVFLNATVIFCLLWRHAK